jgi:gluconolactonase
MASPLSARAFLHLFVGCALMVGVPAGGALAQGGPSGDPAFLPPGAKLEKIVDGNEHDLIFAEGPVVTCDGVVLWSDITFTGVKKGPHGGLRAGNIMRFDPRSGEVSVFRSPSGMSNGLRIDRDCNLLAAEGADYGGQRITRTDLKTGRAEIVAGLYQGRPFNAPNDITTDSKGRIYFSDPRYLGHEPIEQATMAVYRVDPDGSVHQVVTDAGKPNGVAVSPDETTLYVVSNDDGRFDVLRNGTAPITKGAMALLRYDLDADGNASNRQVLVDYLPEDGPDGMIVDADGDLWVAVRNAKRPGIYAYTPKGEEKAYIPTTIPTNVHFGRGEDANLLYITADSSLYRIRTNKRGHHMQQQR